VDPTLDDVQIEPPLQRKGLCIRAIAAYLLVPKSTVDRALRTRTLCYFIDPACCEPAHCNSM
jgi:hypothetical protein